MKISNTRLAADAKQVGSVELEPITQPYRKLYRSEYAEQARKLCLLGLDDSALADFFETDTRTLNTWKRGHRELYKAISRGRLQASTNVTQALYQRAVGYSVLDVHESTYKGKVTLTETTKHIPPSVNACIFWLSLRMPKQWGRSRATVSVCK